MKVQCPRCKTKLEVDPAANKDKCPVCGYEFPIPHKAPRSVPISEAVSTPLSPGKSKSKNPVFLIGGAAVLVLGLVSSGVTWWILRSPAKVASAPLAVPQDAPKPAAQPLASIPASTPREDKTSQEIARLRAEEDKTSQEIARLRAENDRLRALTSPAVKPTPSPQAIEPLYGKVSGAAWSVKNDGTSNLLRGIPIVIVEKETTEIPELVRDLKKAKNVWAGYADRFTRHLAQDRGIQELADDDKADLAIVVAKAKAIQATIDKVSGTKSIDRLLALKLEKQAIQLDKPLSDGPTNDIDATPAVIIGGGATGNDLGAGKTNVDGKFVIDKVRAGDYYLVSFFESGTLIIEWIVPIHVDGGTETTVDLDNDNAAYIWQR